MSKKAAKKGKRALAKDPELTFDDDDDEDDDPYEGAPDAPVEPPVVVSKRERPDLTLVPEDVKAAYTRLSADLARQGELLAEASRAAAEAKTVRDHRQAEVYLALLEDSAGEKKPTEAYLKAKVTTNSRYQTVLQALIAAEYEKNLIASDMEALRTKKEMLISLGAHIRLELRADPSLHDDDDDDDDKGGSDTRDDDDIE